jgi:uncharacterized protein YqeY
MVDISKKNTDMTLEEHINNDLKEAMKAKDQVALRGIRAIKSAILLYKTSGAAEALDGPNEIKLLQKLVKQRKDSLDIYEKQSREDLAVVEREEIAIIERYLPQQLSPAALEEIIRSVITETGAAGPKDMGKVIAAVNKKVAGQAEGKVIAELVKKLLS